MRSKTPEEIFKEEKRTIGQKIADGVTNFAGSWTFITLFLFVLCAWMAINSLNILPKTFDPYPFILLNLVLSCLAAIQAPIILMSNRRQSQKDSLISEQDYLVDVEAERKISEIKDMMILIKVDLEKIKKNSIEKK